MAASFLSRGVGLFRLSRKTTALLSGSRCFSQTEPEPLTVKQQQDGIRRIILNNPRKRNALSLSMLESLRENIVTDLNSDDLRVIIISARGPVFSSGHDLKELTSAQGRDYHTKVFHTCAEVTCVINNFQQLQPSPPPPRPQRPESVLGMPMVTLPCVESPLEKLSGPQHPALSSSSPPYNTYVQPF